MKKKYDKITEDLINTKHRNYCAFCKTRVNFQIIQSKPFQGKIIQYLRCPKCRTSFPQKVLKEIKIFKYNPKIDVKNAKKK